MKKTFKKIGVLALSLLLIVVAMPICATAADVIDVELDGLNVTATEGTIGTGAATIGEDYTTVLTASEGYEIFDVGVYAPYHGDALHPTFDFDHETGVITVSTKGLSEADGIVIVAVAGRSFNYETDVTDVAELPYSDTYTLEATDIIKDFRWTSAAKVFKVDLASDEALDVKFYGTDNEKTDTMVEIYTYNEESGLEYKDRLSGHFGVEGVFVPEEQGTYYVVTMCNNNYIGERCSLELSIYEEPNNEEEPIPTPGTGTGSGSSSGVGSDDIYDVIIPDIEIDVPPSQNVENPDIPDTSVESNTTALAVLSLTVAGALAFTFKRKKK